MDTTSGYSGTPLPRKLGLQAGQRICLLHEPTHYLELIGGLPKESKLVKLSAGALDIIHYFCTQKSKLVQDFPQLKQALSNTGSLWISWPKQAAKVETNLNENLIREIGLKNGLVDIKVAAIDTTWSGLKFVYRLSDR